MGEIVAKWGDERRTKIVPFDGEVSMEDLIAREDVVVTITRTGYAKRTKTEIQRDYEYLTRAWENIRETTMHSIADNAAVTC